MQEIIGIYGAGTIGVGQATLVTGNGFQTVVVGHTEAGLMRCRHAVEQNWDDLIARGLATGENKRAAMGLLIVTNDPAALKDCTVVFEAVAEDLSIKRQVYEKIETYCGKDTIIASCTSSLDANLLAEQIRDRKRFLVAHPFQPVHLQPLVELVRCAETDSKTLERMRSLLDALHRQTVVLHKSVPGFLVNRFAQALYRESLSLLENGVVSVEDIDRAVKYAVGMRYAAIGLLEYFDAVGFELERSIAENIYPTLCNKTQIQPIVSEGIRRGTTGQKAGQGLYKWTEEALTDFRRRLQEPFFDQARSWNMP